MNKLKTIALATATASLMGMMPLAAHAADGDLTEARQEGSIWTAIALNRHLNPQALPQSSSSTSTLILHFIPPP